MPGPSKSPCRRLRACTRLSFVGCAPTRTNGRSGTRFRARGAESSSSCGRRMRHLACSLPLSSSCRGSFWYSPVASRTQGVTDFPKLQNKNDPNLAIVPGDHPFINAAALEAEGVALLQRLITDLYTKQYVWDPWLAVTLTNCIAHTSPF